MKGYKYIAVTEPELDQYQRDNQARVEFFMTEDEVIEFMSKPFRSTYYVFELGDRMDVEHERTVENVQRYRTLFGKEI